jgi:hypothetical protein
MNNQPNNYPPPLLERPRNKSNTGAIILIVAILVIGGGMLGGISMFKSATSTSSVASKTSEECLTDIQDYNYTAADGLMIPDAQKSTPVST